MKNRISRSKERLEEAVEALTFAHDGHWFTIDFSNRGECYENDTGQESGEFKRLMDEAIRELEFIERSQ